MDALPFVYIIRFVRNADETTALESVARIRNGDPDDLTPRPLARR
ncbi:MAG TPA: hypothetical protein VH279_13205 [Solirubrobacteraceae bacterium]|nr:hypothetical protein [Solirubrobacteraceae bacterium]